LPGGAGDPPRFQVRLIGVDGGHAGVEAVIDKDLASALLAIGLRADLLVLATDVDAVYTGLGHAGPARGRPRDARPAACTGVRWRLERAEGRPCAAWSRQLAGAARSDSSKRFRGLIARDGRNADRRP
jgi:amino acid kinase family protein